MTTLVTDHPKITRRNGQWLRVAAVGLGALLLLAAATDQRHAISYRMSGDTMRVDQQVPPASTEGMIREMLMHD